MELIMKHLLSFVIAFILTYQSSNAQVTGSFIVQGSIENYYPVVFTDGNWIQNIATELELGRASVHTDQLWRGSMISKFRFHCDNWGNLTSFIEADIKQNPLSPNFVRANFIGGWRDATANNNDSKIIIWLRGGTTTYYYKANITVSPVVYDGVANSLPYQERNGPQHTFLTVISPYVNNQGIAVNSIYTTGPENNYFAGRVLIGKTSQANTSYLLDINGNVRANKVTINTTGADFVFEPNYKLIPLDELEKFVKSNHHLPGIASAAKMQKDGLELSESHTNLLQKIEELTLYIIEQDKNNKALRLQAENHASQINDLKAQLLKLTIAVEKLTKNNSLGRVTGSRINLLDNKWHLD